MLFPYKLNESYRIWTNINSEGNWRNGAAVFELEYYFFEANCLFHLLISVQLEAIWILKKACIFVQTPLSLPIQPPHLYNFQYDNIKVQFTKPYLHFNYHIPAYQYFFTFALDLIKPRQKPTTQHLCQKQKESR